MPLVKCDGMRHSTPRRDGGSVGPLALLDREPRQARKGATVAIDAGAGVWLAGPPPFSNKILHRRGTLA